MDCPKYIRRDEERFRTWLGCFSMGRKSKDGRDERIGAVYNGVLKVSPRLRCRSGVGVQCRGCARTLRTTERYSQSHSAMSLGAPVPNFGANARATVSFVRRTETTIRCSDYSCHDSDSWATQIGGYTRRSVLQIRCRSVVNGDTRPTLFALGVLAFANPDKIRTENQEGFVTVSVLAGTNSWALPFPEDGTGAAGTFTLPSRTRLCRQNNASSRRSATPSLS